MPDPSSAITYGVLGASLSATVTVGGIVFSLFRKIWPAWFRIEQFLEDWTGQPARPGFPAVPGVPARLEAVEKSQEDMAAQLGVIGQAQASLAASQEQKAAAIQALSDRFDGLQHRMDVAHPEDPDPRTA